MIANAPYIEPCVYDYFNAQIINECIINTNENEDYIDDNTIFFLNAYKNREFQRYSTEEIIDKEQSICKQIGDITKVQTFIKNTPELFASSSEQFVITAFEEMRNGLMLLSLDLLCTDISQEEECLFMYGQKNDIKLFFNLFFENDDVEALVNVSTPNKKYVIEDNIENSIKRLFEIFQKEELYGHLS
jgi:hypothetical protein